MCNDDGCAARCKQNALQLKTQFLPQFGIKRGKRFIEKHKFWSNGDSASQGYTLLLPTAQQSWPLRLVAPESYQVDHLTNPHRYFVLLDTALAQAISNVLLDRKMRKESVILKNEPDIALIWRNPCHIAPSDSYPSLIGLEKPRNHSQSRRLTAATWSKECDDFAFFNAKGDVANSRERAEALTNVAEFEDRAFHII